VGPIRPAARHSCRALASLYRPAVQRPRHPAGTFYPRSPNASLRATRNRKERASGWDDGRRWKGRRTAKHSAEPRGAPGEITDGKRGGWLWGKRGGHRGELRIPHSFDGVSEILHVHFDPRLPNRPERAYRVPPWPPLDTTASTPQPTLGRALTCSPGAMPCEMADLRQDGIGRDRSHPLSFHEKLPA
jgi:hypothetical protein